MSSSQSPVSILPVFQKVPPINMITSVKPSIDPLICCIVTLWCHSVTRISSSQSSIYCILTSSHDGAKTSLLHRSNPSFVTITSFTDRRATAPPAVDTSAFSRSDVTRWCHRVCRPGPATRAAPGGRGRRSRGRRAGWGRGRAPAAAPGRTRLTGGGPDWGESRPCWSTPAGGEEDDVIKGTKHCYCLKHKKNCLTLHVRSFTVLLNSCQLSLNVKVKYLLLIAQLLRFIQFFHVFFLRVNMNYLVSCCDWTVYRFQSVYRHFPAVLYLTVVHQLLRPLNLLL